MNGNYKKKYPPCVGAYRPYLFFFEKKCAHRSSNLNMARLVQRTLCNGTSVPTFGLGTWRSNPGQVQSAVETALGLGAIMCSLL